MSETERSIQPNPNYEPPTPGQYARRSILKMALYAGGAYAIARGGTLLNSKDAFQIGDGVILMAAGAAAAVKGHRVEMNPQLKSDNKPTTPQPPEDAPKVPSPYLRHMELPLKKRSFTSETYEAFRDIIEEKTLLIQAGEIGRKYGSDHPEYNTAYQAWQAKETENEQKASKSIQERHHEYAAGRREAVAVSSVYRHNEWDKWDWDIKNSDELDAHVLELFSGDFSEIEKKAKERESQQSSTPPTK